MTTQNFDTQTPQVLGRANQLHEQSEVPQQQLVSVDTQQQVIDPNVVTLSTGTVVRFKRINPQFIQDTVASVSEHMNTDGSGNVIELEDSGVNNLKAYGKISEYHDILVRLGVELLSDMPTDTDWLDEIEFVYREKIDTLKLNIRKEKDRNFLYLRHIAFQSPEDWSILSEKIMQLSQ